MKKFLLPLIFIIFFLTNSCSRLDIAVQFANTYVVNKADDYFDLTKEQTKWVRKNFEKDGALDRRFQKVIVEQPSVEETIQILTNIKSKYEDYHKQCVQ